MTVSTASLRRCEAGADLNEDCELEAAGGGGAAGDAGAEHGQEAERLRRLGVGPRRVVVEHPGGEDEVAGLPGRVPVAALLQEALVQDRVLERGVAQRRGFRGAGEARQHPEPGVLDAPVARAQEVGVGGEAGAAQVELEDLADVAVLFGFQLGDGDVWVDLYAACAVVDLVFVGVNLQRSPVQKKQISIFPRRLF